MTPNGPFGGSSNYQLNQPLTESRHPYVCVISAYGDKMSNAPTWTKETPYSYAVEHCGRRVELQYEEDGFRSGWAVYAGESLIRRCSELLQARGVAMAVVAGREP